MRVDGRARRSRRRAESSETEPLRALLDGLASGAPTPGGGAAAALAGAAAAGLVAMVARVTAARESLGSAGDAVAKAAATADRLRRRLTRLIERDAKAFGALLAARRTAAGASRARAQRALRGATAVPVDVARQSADVLLLGAALAPHARASTLPDLATAAALAGAALDAGAITARANLADLDDRVFVGRTAKELARLGATGRRARHRLAAALARRARGALRAVSDASARLRRRRRPGTH